MCTCTLPTTQRGLCLATPLMSVIGHIANALPLWIFVASLWTFVYQIPLFLSMTSWQLQLRGLELVDSWPDLYSWTFSFDYLPQFISYHNNHWGRVFLHDSQSNIEKEYYENDGNCFPNVNGTDVAQCDNVKNNTAVGFGQGLAFMTAPGSFQDFQLSGFTTLVQGQRCIQVATNNNLIAWAPSFTNESTPANLVGLNHFAIDTWAYMSPCSKLSTSEDFVSPFDIVTDTKRNPVLSVSTGYVNHVVKLLMPAKCQDLSSDPDLINFQKYLSIVDDVAPPTPLITAAECSAKYSEIMSLWLWFQFVYIFAAIVVMGALTRKKTNDVATTHYLLLTALCCKFMFLHVFFLTNQGAHSDGLYHWLSAYLFGLAFAWTAGQSVVSLNGDRFTKDLGVDNNLTFAYRIINTVVMTSLPVILALVNLFGTPFNDDEIPNIRTKKDSALLYFIVEDDDTRWAVISAFFNVLLTIASFGILEILSHVDYGTVSLTRVTREVVTKYVRSMLFCDYCRMTLAELEEELQKPVGTQAPAQGHYLKMQQIRGQIVMDAKQL
jgi:hypothetical protein